MKYAWIAGIIASALATNALAFEGTFDVQGGSGKNTMTMHITVSAKGDSRTDMSIADDKGKLHKSTIISPAKGEKRYVVSDERKTVMVMNKDMTSSAKAAGRVDKKDYTVQNLGSESVEGEATTRVRITNVKNGDITDAWISKKYPPALLDKAFQNGRDQRDESGMADMMATLRQQGIEPGLPIRIHVERPKAAKPAIDLSIRNIKQGAVPASAFEIPQGYAVQDMAEMQKKMPKMDELMTDGKIDQKKVLEMQKRYGGAQ